MPELHCWRQDASISKRSPNLRNTPARRSLRDTSARRSHTLLAFLAVALVATVIVAPFVRYGNVSGHDFEFHTSSWLDVASQWKQGVLYPRWAQWANWGFGEPRFIFYPPGSWMLGAALGSVLPWRAVPGAFIWLVAMASGMSMYFFARRWLPPRRAILAAILYAANPYALVVIYLRSDFAEVLAASFFPLLLLFALRAAESPSAAAMLGRRATFARVKAARVTASLAAVFAAIWLCNAPAGVMATYTLCLLVAVLAIERRTMRPLFIGASAMTLGALLAGFFIVPAAYEQRWVNISRALSSGLRPEENFLFTHTSDPEHNSFNLIVSAIAVVMLVFSSIAAIGIALARRRSSVQDANRRDAHPIGSDPSVANASALEGREEPTFAPYWPLLVLTAAIAALMFPITALLWHWLPKLRFLQFPWRWLGPLGVSFAYFLAAAPTSSKSLNTRVRLRRFSQIFALVSILGAGLFILRHAWWETDDLQVLQSAVATEQGFDGTDEYDPIDDDHYDLPKRAPQAVLATRDGKRVTSEEAPPAAIEPRIQIERWAPEEKIIQVDAADPAQIALRLLTYPAWRVEVNDRLVHPSSPPGTAQMLIKIPAGHNRVHINFVRTADRTVGSALSIIGIGILLLLLIKGKREKGKKRIRKETLIRRDESSM
jgi:hypothetical protein